MIERAGGSGITATQVVAYTNDAAPTSDDLAITVNDPGGTAALRKVTLANLFVNTPIQGWTQQTAPAAVANLVKAWAADYAAGDTRLWFQSESGNPIAIGNNSIGIYNTADITTNYEKAELKFSANTLYLTEAKGGSGTARDFFIQSNSSLYLDGASTVAVRAGGSLITFYLNNVGFSFFTAATDNDPRLDIVQTRIATTDATPTTLQTITLAADQTYLIEARVVARRTGGVSGSDGDCATYIIKGTYNKIGAGNAAIVGALEINQQELVAGYDATLTLSGSTVLVTVTGVATTNITWHVTTFSQYMSI